MRLPTRGEAGYYFYSYLACVLVIGSAVQAASILIDYAHSPIEMPLVSEIGRISCAAGLLFAFRMCMAMSLYELARDSVRRVDEISDEDRAAVNKLRSQISAAMFRRTNGEHNE